MCPKPLHIPTQACRDSRIHRHPNRRSVLATRHRHSTHSRTKTTAATATSHGAVHQASPMPRSTAKCSQVLPRSRRCHTPPKRPPLPLPPRPEKTSPNPRPGSCSTCWPSALCPDRTMKWPHFPSVQIQASQSTNLRRWTRKPPPLPLPRSHATKHLQNLAHRCLPKGQNDHAPSGWAAMAMRH